MLYTRSTRGLAGGQIGDTAIEPFRGAAPAAAHFRASGPDWTAISGWAHDLAASVALDWTAQHVAVFVPDPDRSQLRLAAQIWGAGEDTGDVVVGEWVIPLDGSVIGRVFQSGAAALCADVTLDPDYRSFPGGRTRSFLTVAVGSPEQVLAVINVEAPWASAFSVRDYENVTERARRAAATFPAPPAVTFPAPPA
ncbi:MAG: hypothetical protein M3Q66_05675 [Chloroflexota bacterium]|nr:hypothetical protein [Chloroflexota bacterium]